MLKYVALLSVDQPARWHEWRSRPTVEHFRSSIESDKRKVEEWLEEELKKYPDASINSNSTGHKYFIHTAIIAFEENQSDNVEGFIQDLIPVEDFHTNN